MTVKIITDPAFEPVSLAEARLWLRIDDDDTTQDPVIELLIKAMREHAEESLTGRAFVSRTLRLSLPAFPAVIELPYPPLISVTSVKYIDDAGALQTVAAADYEIDFDREPALIQPAYLKTWPSTRSVFNAVQVVYVAGHPSGSPSDAAAARETIPASLKLWMRARIATLFEQREQIMFGNQVEVPRNFADGILDGLIVGTRIA